MSRCGECKLGSNEEGALYCEENLGYEQCIDRLQDALYVADRPPKVVAPVTFDEEKLREIVKEAVERFKEEYEITDRPQGEWIPASWQDENCPERLRRHKCSACGNRAKMVLVKTKLVDNYYCNKAEPITEYTHQEQLSDFCPHCGARMKGADDEGN